MNKHVHPKLHPFLKYLVLIIKKESHDNAVEKTERYK